MDANSPSAPQANDAEEVPMQNAAELYTSELEEKILYGLSIYRFLNPSMLHVFLGTSTPVALWKNEVLRKLLEEGRVVSVTFTLTSPAGRSQTYEVLHLPENEYIPPSITQEPQVGLDEVAA